MNNMMAGMNPGVGGPVGAGMAMMNNAGTPGEADQHENLKTVLNTQIYDYLLKNGHFDIARTLVKDDKFHIHFMNKSSPGRQVNGVDEMDADSKNIHIPDDLPRPSVPESSGGGFLFDWHCLFTDIYKGARSKGKPGQVSITRQYLQQTESLQRLRDSQQNSQMMRNPAVMQQIGQMNGMRNMQNGAMPNELQKRVGLRNMNMTQQQLQQMQQKQMMQNIQRDPPEMDVNGRPQSPGSGENTGSPNKRPRLEGSQFNGQPLGPNGRGQGMQPQMANNPMTAMMMQNGMNPQGMTPAQFQQFQKQNPGLAAKSIQGSMQNGIINPGMMPGQGSPMLQPDGNFMGDGQFNQAAVNQMRANLQQNANGQGGNHALQDYQMQLMLLEQQNKKRLMMARQEQDNMRPDGQPAGPGQPGMQPPGMSPSGSRNGPSPNPTDQMKRTPQLGQQGIPGSPTPGGPGGSPAPMNFNGQMGGEFNPQMLGMMQNQGVRPPNGMNPNMQAGRMPGGNWQGGPGGQPMMPQQSQQGGQPQAGGTPQQRNEMPPPQAPAPSGNAGRGTQPSSPAASAQAPPTPQQTNKANPKASKKASKADAKRPQKKGSAAAGANTETAEPPATPTPSTPITPVHPNSFKNNAASANANAAPNTSAPAPSQPAPANAGPQAQGNAPAQQPGNVQGASAGDPGAMGMGNGGFGDFNGVDPSFNLDFGPLDAPDVLENFDFDSFLNNPDDSTGGVGGFSFDAGMGLDGGYGVEGGAEV